MEATAKNIQFLVFDLFYTYIRLILRIMSMCLICIVTLKRRVCLSTVCIFTCLLLVCRTLSRDCLRPIHFIRKYLGMESVLRQTNKLSLKQFETICNRKLKERFSNVWKYKPNKQESKLTLYNDLNIADFHRRKLITCSDDNLGIEIGRHNNLPRENITQCSKLYTESPKRNGEMKA